MASLYDNLITINTKEVVSIRSKQEVVDLMNKLEFDGKLKGTFHIKKMVNYICSHKPMPLNMTVSIRDMEFSRPGVTDKTKDKARYKRILYVMDHAIRTIPLERLNSVLGTSYNKHPRSKKFLLELTKLYEIKES